MKKVTGSTTTRTLLQIPGTVFKNHWTTDPNTEYHVTSYIFHVKFIETLKRSKLNTLRRY